MNYSHRLHAAIALLSVALIAFQLVLMQLLSIVQWYHFAYMVISVALLGFGASGTVLALARTWLLRRSDVLVPLLTIGSGAAMTLATWLSQMPAARFDSYLLFVDASQRWALLLTYGLFFVPFFLGALAIGLVFVERTERVGSYYFANLLGSGVGGLAAIGLLWAVSPARLPAVTALLPVVAGLLILPGRRRGWLLASAAAALLLSALFALYPPGLARSEYKSISYALSLPEAEVVLRESSPYGLVEVVRAPALRHAPGLSLQYVGEVPTRQAVFLNGNLFGPVPAWSRRDTTQLLDYTTAALPYAMGPRERVLVLNARTGEDVAHALARGARRVDAVEPNTTVLELLSEPLAPATDSLLYHRAVAVHPLEPRTFLSTAPSDYDLITLPAVGAFGGTVGLSALQEQYTLTRQAFREMWDRLAPGGVLSITAWMDYPYRAPLKVLATLTEMLHEAGVQDPAAHLAALRSWGAITFVAKKTPLTEAELHRIRRFAQGLGFDPALLPGLAEGERTRYNQLPAGRFFEYVDALLSPERERLYAAYDFDLEPATDDRPYFSQFLRWRSLPQLAEGFGGQTFPFLEIGSLIAGVTFVQIFFAALVLILLPLLRLGWRGRGKGWTLVYFGGLGLGYLFVEIVLIQRFTLYLGHPLYATAAVLTTMLVCSGFGSLLSERIAVRRGMLLRAAGAVALLLLLYAFALTPLLKATIGLSPELKVACAFVLIALPAFFMGMPFPLGLRLLSAREAEQVPWAWGINGCLSVVSTAAAALLAVEVGFFAVVLVAAGAYAAVALVNF